MLVELGAAREYPAVVERVVDGDTLHVMVDHGFFLTTKQIIRVAGVNCPELSTAEGRKVRDDVMAWAPAGTALTLRSYGKTDKYGRRIADLVSADGQSLSSWLLSTGRAVAYMV